MLKIISFIIACSGIFCSLNAFSLETTQAVNPSPVYTESKTNIMLSGKERTFAIHLKSNPTTGYRWYLRDDYSKMITPIGHRFVPSETKLIGSGGVEEWEFRVSDQAMAYPHQLTLRMIYARSFQGTEGSSSVVFRISTQP